MAMPRRLIGSIRRECLDHVIVLGEAHLRRVLRDYSHYYNTLRTHWSLVKDAPLSRPVQRNGSILTRRILGGLHHALRADLGFRYRQGSISGRLELSGMANVTAVRLLTDTNLPGIAFELDDGTYGCVYGNGAQDMPGLLNKLSFSERRKYQQLMDAYADLVAQP